MYGTTQGHIRPSLAWSVSPRRWFTAVCSDEQRLTGASYEPYPSMRLSPFILDTLPALWDEWMARSDIWELLVGVYVGLLVERCSRAMYLSWPWYHRWSAIRQFGFCGYRKRSKLWELTGSSIPGIYYARLETSVDRQAGYEDPFAYQHCGLLFRFILEFYKVVDQSSLIDSISEHTVRMETIGVHLERWGDELVKEGKNWCSGVIRSFCWNANSCP